MSSIGPVGGGYPHDFGETMVGKAKDQINKAESIINNDPYGDPTPAIKLAIADLEHTGSHPMAISHLKQALADANNLQSGDALSQLKLAMNDLNG